jgi:two-component system response regulator CpxR
MTRVLLVDDDVEFLSLLVKYLSTKDFDIDTANDGAEALQKIRSGDSQYDVIVLDVMLPMLDGFGVLQRLRESSTTPVIMLTARGDESDRIDGLDMGADDYLAKPCNPRELVARIRAILRRSQQKSATAHSPINVGDIEILPGSRSVKQNGETVDLTSTEYILLETLAREAGSVIDKGVLAETVLGRKLTMFDRSIDMHVSNLRKKLGPNVNGSARIKTIRGQGYLYVTS